MRIFTCILLVLLCVGCSQYLDKEHPLYTENQNIKTENHTRIKGTKIFMVIPDGFQDNQQLRLYSANKQSIKFLKIQNTSWPEFIKKGDVLGRETIPIYGYQGNYIELEDTKSKIIEIIVQFGGDDFVYMITARTSNVKEDRDQIVKILQSLYYDDSFELDELELANFTFDRSIIDYNYVGGVKGPYILTKDSKNKLPQANYIWLKSSTLSYYKNIEDLFSDYMSSEKKRGIKFKSEEIRDTIIGEYNVKIIESETKFQSKSGIYCHGILSLNDNLIEVIAIGNEDLEELKSSFTKIVESIKFKSKTIANKRR